MDNLLQLSAKELSRLEVMQRLAQQRISHKEASRILGLSTRQIKRLLKRYRQQGAAGLVSKHRGRKDNNHVSEDVKRKALNLFKTKYQGFGPTLAHEKLVEKDKLKLSDESVRKLNLNLINSAISVFLCSLRWCNGQTIHAVSILSDMLGNRAQSLYCFKAREREF